MFESGLSKAPDEAWRWGNCRRQVGLIRPGGHSLFVNPLLKRPALAHEQIHKLDVLDSVTFTHVRYSRCTRSAGILMGQDDPWSNGVQKCLPPRQGNNEGIGYWSFCFMVNPSRKRTLDFSYERHLLFV